MNINLRIMSSVAAIAFTCVMSAAAYYYKSRTAEINEVMIFCKLQYNACNYFDKLISYIESAKRSLNVCMPGIHNSAIQGRLIELIKTKNVKVCIIIDQSGYNESTEILIKELINAGAVIKYKVNEPLYKMQHKFCLIDDKILMTGTLNWGNDRSSDHWNYVYITSKPQLVEPVKKEFYHMWNKLTCDVRNAPLFFEPVIFCNNNGTVKFCDPLETSVENKEEKKLMEHTRSATQTPELILT